MDGWLLAAKIFFILFNLGVIAFIIYVWVSTTYLRRLFVWDIIEFFTYRAWDSRLIDNDWRKIRKRLLSKSETEYKLAVIDADLLVNDVLTRSAFEGKTLADKLQNAKAERFTDIEAMKNADQVYQKIVGDPTFELDYQTAKTAILAFEQGLKDISAFRNK